MASADRDRPSLFDLPAELVVHIVEYVAAEQRSLCRLARTCRLLQVECEKHLYTTIELFSTGRLRYIIDAFARRPERIASVETLKILYQFHDGLVATAQERKAFNCAVAQMKALKHWHVESPFDNFNWNKAGAVEWVDQDMEHFRLALETASFQLDDGKLLRQEHVGLAKLEKLVIHSHGASSDFWDLNGFHCLFRHPSLRHLHASCFVLPPDLPELEPYAKMTPLTTLIFDECELEPKSLGRILHTPKALKHLTLGENVYNIRLTKGVSPRLSRSAEAALEALKAVAHSLESLKHNDPLWRVLVDMYSPRPIKGDGLRDFHHLKFLDVDPCSFLHQLILFSRTQAPPNLETLRIHHARLNITDIRNRLPNDLFEDLPNSEPYMYVESLKTLELVQGASAETWMSQPHHICAPDRVRERHAYAYKLSKHGIDLKMYLEATWKDGLMPPYLYDEPKPELVCVYDSTQIGFHRYVGLADSAETARRTSVRRIWFGNHDDPNEDEDTDSSNPSRSLSNITATHSSVSKSHEQTSPEATGPSETDQLNDDDILRLKNELTRSLDKIWKRMGVNDSDEEENGGHAIHVIIGGDDDFDIEHDDDDDEDEGDGEWYDAEEFDEDDDDDEDMQVEWTAGAGDVMVQVLVHGPGTGHVVEEFDEDALTENEDDELD